MPDIRVFPAARDPAPPQPGGRTAPGDQRRSALGEM